MKKSYVDDRPLKTTYIISNTMAALMTEPLDNFIGHLKQSLARSLEYKIREIAGPFVQYVTVKEPEIFIWDNPATMQLQAKGRAVYDVPVKARLIFKV